MTSGASEPAAAAEHPAVAQLEAVHRVAVALHRGGSPSELYEEAVDAVVAALGVDRASLLVFDDDGVMRFKASRGLSERYREAVEGHTPWTPGQGGARPIPIADVTVDPALASLAPVLEQEGIGAVAFVPLLHDGGVVGKFMLYYDAPHDFSASELTVGEILAAHVALALDRRRREEAMDHARAEAETAAARLAKLGRVTAELSGAASVDDVAGVVLGTALAELGAATGSLCLRHGDELEIAYAVGYPEDVMGRWRRFPLNADLPASEAVRTGRAVFISSPAERDARYPVFASTPVVGSQAFAVIPLGEVTPFGCLVLGFTEAHSLSERDESFFSELALRCAVALERARLFAERSAIAETLQASLLPPELPDVPGVDFAARYVAAGRGVEVGGDFYDVFRIDAGRFVVVLGDVCGRGVGAASLAALCRHTVRSAVVSAADPAAILSHLNEVLLRQSVDVFEPRFCTVLVGVGSLVADGVQLELALGGHPPPVLRRTDGTVTPVGRPGFVLGVSPQASIEPTTVVLAPGDALVCVTDGVLERRGRAGVFGDTGLAATVASCPVPESAAIAAAVEAAVVSFSDHDVGDDLAVLVLGVRPQGRAAVATTAAAGVAASVPTG